MPPIKQTKKPVPKARVGKRPMGIDRPHDMLAPGMRPISYSYNREKRTVNIDVRPEINETRVINQDYKVVMVIPSTKRSEVQMKLRLLSRKLDADQELREHLAFEPKEGSLNLELDDSFYKKK